MSVSSNTLAAVHQQLAKRTHILILSGKHSNRLRLGQVIIPAVRAPPRTIMQFTIQTMLLLKLVTNYQTFGDKGAKPRLIKISIGDGGKKPINNKPACFPVRTTTRPAGNRNPLQHVQQ